jgi:hypothetical protein
MFISPQLHLSPETADEFLLRGDTLTENDRPLNGDESI